MTRSAPFRQSDLKRAIAAGKAAGVVYRIVLEHGRVTLEPVDAPTAEDEGEALRRRMDEAFGT